MSNKAREENLLEHFSLGAVCVSEINCQKLQISNPGTLYVMSQIAGVPFLNFWSTLKSGKGKRGSRKKEEKCEKCKTWRLAQYLSLSEKLRRDLAVRSILTKHQYSNFILGPLSSTFMSKNPVIMLQLFSFLTVYLLRTKI